MRTPARALVRAAASGLLVFALPASLVIGVVVLPLAVRLLPVYGVLVGVTLALVALVREDDPSFAVKLVRYALVVLAVGVLAMLIAWAISPAYMNPMGSAVVRWQ